MIAFLLTKPTVSVGMEPEGVLEIGGASEHKETVSIVVGKKDAERLRDVLDKALRPTPKGQRPMSQPLTSVVIDRKGERNTDDDTHIGKYMLPAVPRPGESLFIGGKRYRVYSREWHLAGSDFWVHLRVDVMYT